MKLFANGCSFTFGGGLYQNHNEDSQGMTPYAMGPRNQQRLQVTYPGRLKDKLGADQLFNYSVNGGSNERIVRTTLEFFYNLLDQGKNVTEYLALIQWTELVRTEYNLDGYWYNFHPMGSSHDVGTGLTEVHEPRDDKLLAVRSDLYYKNLQGDHKDVSDFLMQVTTLGNFFKLHKIPYVFYTHVDTFLWVKAVQETPLVNQRINENFTWLNGCLNKCILLEMLTPELQVSKDDAHPNLQGHQLIADNIYNWITERRLV